MTSYLRAKVTVPHGTGLPSLAVVNTWSLMSFDPASREGAADDFTTALTTFYTTLKANLASYMSWNEGTIEYVDLGDAKPRVPFQTDALNLGTLSSAGEDMPPEVAICLSFRGATGSGLNAKRRRGRIYVGPLQLNSAEHYVVPTSLVDGVANAASVFMGATYFKWAVHSPSTFHGVPYGESIKDYPDEIPSALDDSFVEVVSHWVDNEFDTQRRRGVPATYRKTL